MSERKPSYWELLRDPRWQRKRLEVMQRDDFTCQCCDKKTQTLNVHHMYYERGLSPWEYPNESLQTLCEDCHEFIEGRLTELKRAIGLSDWHDIEFVIGFLRGKRSRFDGPGQAVVVDSYEVAAGVACAWEINVDRVIDIAKDSKVLSDELSELYVQEREARKVKKDGKA